MWADLTAVLALLLISAFLSLSETAFTAASRARMLALEKSGEPRAARLARLIEAREKVVASLLLGNNLVNVLASSLATGAFLVLFGEAGILYATVVMTTLIVVFGEVMPKSYAVTNPDRSALFFSRLIAGVDFALRPFARAAEWIARCTLALFGIDAAAGQAVLSPHEELRGAVDLMHLEGGVVKEDRDMLGGLLDLRELEVSDIMVHRTKMQMLNADDPPGKIVSEVLASPHTRLPLWRGKPENIVGVLHAKDLLRALEAVKGDVETLDIVSLAAPPWFVPDTTSLADQLKAFLRRKAHFALVVDEYGEVMGLVTLEDILEEIVGDISDEHDLVVTGVRPQPDGSVNVDGAVPIRDLNRAMDWRLPDEEATTIAGLVIHAARTIPEPGQAFTFYGFKFEVLRKQRNRITALRITPPRPVRRTPPARVAQAG